MTRSFIEIIDIHNKRRYVNINYIEEVVAMDENSCCIYMAFICPNAIEQDYFIVKRPYEEIVALIRESD